MVSPLKMWAMMGDFLVNHSIFIISYDGFISYRTKSRQWKIVSTIGNLSAGLSILILSTNIKMDLNLIQMKIKERKVTYRRRCRK